MIDPDAMQTTLIRACMQEAAEGRRRAQALLACAHYLEMAALPAAVDLLDTIVRFGDLSEEDDVEDKLKIIIAGFKQAIGELMKEAKAERVEETAQ